MPRMKRCRANGCHQMVAYESRYCKQHEYLANDDKPKRDYSRYNQVTRHKDENKSNQYAFYRTRQWVHLRQQALERDHYVCQYCRLSNVVTPAKTVDHLRPLELFPDDGAKLNNLATICRSCHAFKTKWEQKYYGSGNGNVATGKIPIDNIETINRMMRAL